MLRGKPLPNYAVLPVMSKLGPLPPIGQTSLPEGVTKEAWENSWKESLKGTPNPIAFPDASTCELDKLTKQLEQAKTVTNELQKAQQAAEKSEQKNAPSAATVN
eukprot:TRINITY_DN25035_c0_g1_i1.p1 TRINITY_DN25035_c0_g1~~TRINITY_DN25035_c0_g1_i1.p1  ORF type:complete len:104 (-),score=19.18 TRINITY_DN25035_c0_g1_i1:72-383(-)